MRAALLATLAVAVAGCGSGGSSKTTTTTTDTTTPLAAATSTSTSSSTTKTYTLDAPPATLGKVLAATVVPSSQTQVVSALDALYKNHPDISTFTVSDVSYPSGTRDVVLRVCEHGGPEKTAKAKQSTRLLGCAPLVFLYYSYAQQHNSQEALKVAREIYGYAVTHVKGPYNSTSVLNNLLRSWGVE